MALKIENMNFVWKSKTWWCNRCNHYISGDYKECPYCKILAKEAKEMNKFLIIWKKQRSIIARNNFRGKKH